MFGKLFKCKDKRPPLVKRIIPPHVTFEVQCDKFNSVGYSGFDLKNPLSTSVGYATCPCCKQPYNIRVKNNDDVGHSYKAGSKHIFVITSLNRQDKEREF